MIKNFLNRSAESVAGYSQWLRDNPDGFVWNAEKKKLHVAKCPYLNYKSGQSPDITAAGETKRKTPTLKICAQSKDELIKNVPLARDSNHYCGACRPR